MYVDELIQNLDIQRLSGANVRIHGIRHDSRRVQKGDLFVALPGANKNGAAFVAQAHEKGAVAVLAEDDQSMPGLTALQAANPRAAMAELAARFHGNPSQSLSVIGVTGTNGKTTTTFLVKHILDADLMRCGLIGTVRYDIAGQELPAERTTPEATETQELLARMRDAGCRTAAMEVSSIAIDQKRVDAVRFAVGVFMNLTQDHLDYHGTMENYYEAKAGLFERMASAGEGVAVVNTDDPYGIRLADRYSRELRVLTFGMGANASLRAVDPRSDFNGTSFQLSAEGKSFLVRTPLIGRFNVSNALAALATASALGLNLREAVRALADCPGAPGRLQPVPARQQFRVFVDYAHTPDALLNVLRTLRELRPRAITCLFGCGGDRDRSKRPLMGRIAAQHADRIILTSDNPRGEDPRAIIDGIAEGMEGAAYEVIEDRAEAIRHAILTAMPREIVLIAGKGHEAYQQFADRTIPFDDFHMARRAIENRAAVREDAES